MPIYWKEDTEEPFFVLIWTEIRPTTRINIQGCLRDRSAIRALCHCRRPCTRPKQSICILWQQALTLQEIPVLQKRSKNTRRMFRRTDALSARQDNVERVQLLLNAE